MMKKLFNKIVSITIIFLISSLFVIKFGGPSILQIYIKMGIGDCRKIPILCMAPPGEMIKAEVNREYLRELTPYRFPKMLISVPKGFSVVQERIKKVYYKKGARERPESVIYIDQQDKDFLINLFPRLKKYGIKDDFDLMKNTMSAKIENINNLNNAFFVILKSVFIPDLGDQNKAQMIEVEIGNKKGFINYNVSGKDNFFDCNMFDNNGNFFKVYIKDTGANLDIDKALTIVSTVAAVTAKTR